VPTQHQQQQQQQQQQQVILMDYTYCGVKAN